MVGGEFFAYGALKNENVVNIFESGNVRTKWLKRQESASISTSLSNEYEVLHPLMYRIISKQSSAAEPRMKWGYAKLNYDFQDILKRKAETSIHELHSPLGEDLDDSALPLLFGSLTMDESD